MSKHEPPLAALLLTTDEAVRRQALEDAELREWSTREARRRLDAAERPTAPPFDLGTLREVLDRPAEPPFRVDGLIPSTSSTLVVAQRKTGKSTLNLNLTRSLLTGEPFLGRFETRPVDGRVAILNFEVSARQLAEWAQRAGIDPDRLVLVNLRGRRNPLGDDEDRESLAELLRAQEVEALFVDPFGRAYSGQSENDAHEVGAWLAGLDRFASDVGATDLVLSAHAGWDGSRTRGSTALEDWPDSIITMIRGDKDETQRFLRAEGRDVLVDRDLLAFDPDTLRLTMTGRGSPQAVAKVDKFAALEGAVVQVVLAEPGINTAALERKLRELGWHMQRGDAGRAARSAVDQLVLRREDGGRNSWRYFPADLGAGGGLDTEAARAARVLPMGGLGVVPTRPIGGDSLYDYSGDSTSGRLESGEHTSSSPPAAGDYSTVWPPQLPTRVGAHTFRRQLPTEENPS